MGIEKRRILGSAMPVPVVGAVRAQLVDAMNKLDGCQGICKKPLLHGSHVPNEFFAVSVTGKSLQAQKVMGAKMENGGALRIGRQRIGKLNRRHIKCCIE